MYCLNAIQSAIHIIRYSNATVDIVLNEPLLTEHTQYCPCSTKQAYVILLCFSALTHKCSHALLHSKMSTLHVILDRLPTYYMDNTQNTEQMFTEEIMILLNYTLEMLIVMTKLKSTTNLPILMMIPFVYITLQTKLLKQSEMKKINYPYFL